MRKLVGISIMGLLHLFVGEAGRGAHQAAAELMRGFTALIVDMHFHKHAAAIFIRLQAAPAVGEGLGQHRHDAVREIAGIATLAGGFIQRRTGLHVMRDIGDGDDQPKTVLLRFGEDRIVEIARIGAIDRDERQLAQIGPFAQRRDPGALRFLDGGFRKIDGNFMGRNGNHADRAGIAHLAEQFGDAGGFGAVAAAWHRLRPYNLAVSGAQRISHVHQPFGFLPAVGGLDASAGALGAEHADNAAGFFLQAF